ncbi:MAG: 1-(5-phosphoribosyl)-5-[(5-phosphoribosylamino)methylideneamino]imidazole-4-carboxamide isomerase [Oscillospiraceae bacterium]|nr:1-(5-phosphoribosyl)-5-[(5-phosphoribosylamino)methylideneamino]imidazole-4-carboxamide isomerase [Oscillospiraceae bacterium]
MILYPAIDLVGGKAVRLYKGDYAQMTVYSDDPVSVAKDFQKAGAKRMHLVDLEAAKSGVPENAETIRAIAENTDLFLEVGGGIRTMQTLESYLSLGVDRAILGTAAVTDPQFLREAVEKYGERVAVGVDLKDGFVAIKGWTETSDLTAESFFAKMEALGVKTVICTDISRDGAMKGTNRALYRELLEKFSIDLIASGGVSSIGDIAALKEMGLHGAIIGKAYYTGAIDLKLALEAAR